MRGCRLRHFDRPGQPGTEEARPPSSQDAPDTASVDSPQHGPSSSPLGRGRHSARSVVGRVLVVAITGVALYVVLPSLTRVVAAWPQLTSLSPVWLVAAFLCEVASFGCTFALQRLVLRTKNWYAVVTAGLAGNAVTKVLPGGAAAGAAVQFRMLASAGIDADSVAGGLTAASLLSIGGLLALPIFSLPAVLGGTQVSSGLEHTALLGLAGFGLYVIFGITVIASNRPLALFGRVAERLWNSLPGRRSKVTGLDRRLLYQRDEIRSTLGRNWPLAVVLTTARLGLDYLCLLGALRATGSDPRPSLVLLAYAAAGIVALVPITPGGLGIVEASLSGLLVLANVPGGKALVATLAYRLASYWLPLIAGAIAYPLFRRRYPSGGDRDGSPAAGEH